MQGTLQRAVGWCKTAGDVHWTGLGVAFWNKSRI